MKKLFIFVVIAVSVCAIVFNAVPVNAGPPRYLEDANGGGVSPTTTTTTQSQSTETYIDYAGETMMQTINGYDVNIYINYETEVSDTCQFPELRVRYYNHDNKDQTPMVYECHTYEKSEAYVYYEDYAGERFLENFDGLQKSIEVNEATEICDVCQFSELRVKYFDHDNDPFTENMFECHTYHIVSGVLGADVVEWKYEFSQLFEEPMLTPARMGLVNEYTFPRVSAYSVNQDGDLTQDIYYYYKSLIVTYDEQTYNEMLFILENYLKVIENARAVSQENYEAYLDGFMSEAVSFNKYAELAYSTYNAASEVWESDFDPDVFSNALFSVFEEAVNKFEMNPIQAEKDAIIEDACTLVFDSDSFYHTACKVVLPKAIEAGDQILSSDELNDYLSGVDIDDIFSSFAQDVMVDFLIGATSAVIDEIPGFGTLKKSVVILYNFVMMSYEAEHIAVYDNVINSITYLDYFLKDCIANEENLRIDYAVASSTERVFDALLYGYDTPESIELSFDYTLISKLLFSTTSRTNFATVNSCYDSNGIYRVLLGNVTYKRYDDFIEEFNQILESTVTSSVVEPKAVYFTEYSFALVAIAGMND